MLLLNSLLFLLGMLLFPLLILLYITQEHQDFYSNSQLKTLPYAGTDADGKPENQAPLPTITPIDNNKSIEDLHTELEQTTDPIKVQRLGQAIQTKAQQLSDETRENANARRKHLDEERAKREEETKARRAAREASRADMAKRLEEVKKSRDTRALRRQIDSNERQEAAFKRQEEQIKRETDFAERIRASKEATIQREEEAKIRSLQQQAARAKQIADLKSHAPRITNTQKQRKKV